MCVLLRRQESECDAYFIVWATQHSFSPPANNIPFAFVHVSDSHEAEYHSSYYELGQRIRLKG